MTDFEALKFRMCWSGQEEEQEKDKLKLWNGRIFILKIDTRWQ